MSNCTETFTLANGETVACNRKAAPKNQVSGHEAVCLKCFEAWMMENDHNDNGHDEAVADCPLCGTYDPRTKQGHTKTKGTKQVHRSHADCDHPKTPSARAKCRKARAKGAEVVADAPKNVAPATTINPLQGAYDRLTDKQREQSLIVLDAHGITDMDMNLVMSLTLALVECARAKKTTVAKLSKGDIHNIVTDAL
ncbi:hypothetical protein SEA_BILLDOOR_33 [Gordonia phage BillDoor]